MAVLSDVSGYIRFIDKRRLVALAKHYHVNIRVLRRVGHFVPAGIPLLMVSKADRLPPEGAAELLAAFDFGPTRTLQQDVEFGVLQIVDIALKAISPAVNDPTTAISCVDQLSRILIRFASREPPEDLLYDPPGIVRASIEWIHFDRLLDSAFEQIRMYSKSGRRRQPALAAGPRRHRRNDARSGLPPDAGRARNADGGRLRRKTGRRGTRELRARQAALENFTPISQL